MEFCVLLFVLLLLIFLQNRLFGKYAFRNLKYQCYLSKTEVFEGEEIELVEEITNRKWLPIPWLKSELNTSKWLDFAGSQSVVTGESRFVPSFFMVKSYRKVTRKWKVVCLKRGIFQIDKVILVSTDLLGNVSQSHSVDPGNSTVTVLPTPCNLNQLFFSPTHLMGDILVKRRFVEDPFYIAGVKEYTGREPMHNIHWKATAKEQKVMVFHNEYTSSQSLSVILNIESREFEQGSVIDQSVIELAIKVCACLFDHTLAIGIPVRFSTNSNLSGQREPMISTRSGGQEHVRSLLRLLAGLEISSNMDFTSFLPTVPEDATDFVLVSAYLSEAMISFARRQKSQGRQVKLLILEVLEANSIPEDLEVYCLYELRRAQGGAQ